MSNPPNPEDELIEAGVQQLTILFHNRLEALGIPSLFDDYGPGTHSWPYWARDLQQSIGPLMRDFASPVRAPRRVAFVSADASYEIYGWRVSMHRAVAEFSTLSDAWRHGFKLSGSGSATVLTPAAYRRGALYSIDVGGRRFRERARRDRRLRIDVPLGPSNTVQEFPLDGPAVGTKVFTTTVKIT